VQCARNSLSQWPTRATSAANLRKSRHNSASEIFSCNIRDLLAEGEELGSNLLRVDERTPRAHIAVIPGEVTTHTHREVSAEPDGAVAVPSGSDRADFVFLTKNQLGPRYPNVSLAGLPERGGAGLVVAGGVTSRPPKKPSSMPASAAVTAYLSLLPQPIACCSPLLRITTAMSRPDPGMARLMIPMASQAASRRGARRYSNNSTAPPMASAMGSTTMS